jgi:hypothetical protein
MKALIALCGGASLGLAATGHTATLSAPTTFHGMCDASAAVSLNADLFAVANDEDNILRVYHRQPGGMPAFTFDMTSFLRIGKKKPEADIEASATIGDRVYWITSHGRNAKGKDRPNRERFFATTFTVANGIVKLTPVGRPYAHLLDDLVRAPKLARFNLAAAAKLAPKEPGALNIEGLTTTPEGHLLIGFRNPIPQGKALLVPLLNPAELIEGKPAKLGDPIQLDLGGFGVRSMGGSKENYLIIAGPCDSEGESRAYEWNGSNAFPRHLAGIRFPGLNPEGLAFTTEQGHTDFYVLSDDGTLKIGGVDCKKLKDPAQRQFRGYTLQP